MAWYDFLVGTQPQVQQAPRFSPQQIGGQNQLLQQSLGGLQNLQKPFDFGPIEQQARSGFAQQTVPLLSERFSGMGNNALSSPAFASQLGQAGAGLEENLASLKSQVGLQDTNRQQSLLLNLLQSGLQPQFENLVFEGRPGIGGDIISMLGSILPLLLGAGTGGGGTAIGAGAGLLGSALKNSGGGNKSQFANPSLYSPGMQNLMRGF